MKAGVKRNSAYSIAVYLAQTLSYDKVSHSAARTSTSGCRALCVYTTYQLTAKAKLLEQNGSAFVPCTPPNQTEDNFWKLKDLRFGLRNDCFPWMSGKGNTTGWECKCVATMEISVAVPEKAAN